MVENHLSSSRSSFLLVSVGSMLLYMLGNNAMAGNLEMVEESVRELEELNQKAVQQIPDLPENGTVDLKAKVFYEDGIPVVDVYDQKVTPEKNEEIQFNRGYTVETEKGETK